LAGSNIAISCDVDVVIMNVSYLRYTAVPT
jgi:hypothetical protein